MPLEQRLAAKLGAAALVASDDAERYLTEWRDRVRGKPRLIVRPATVGEVTEVVSACREHGVPIVTQGGNTGLCGGAIPDSSERELLLVLDRLNAIESVDADNDSMIAQAGCTLAALQRAALEHDRLFPLSLAAEGSATIGGSVSTDAGGTNVLRYGTAREQVLGLEVVLPDGRIWNGLRQLRKDTAGYDLKQLFIGAEGTLGVVTRVALRLRPRPRSSATALVAIDDVGSALSLLHTLRRELGERVTAFEWMAQTALEFSIMHTEAARRPFATATDAVLVEVADSGSLDLLEPFQAVLASVIDEGGANDAVVATSERESAEFWRLRHNISEAQKSFGASLKHDVSLPASAITSFLTNTNRSVEKRCPGIRICVFGHLGDGNLHYNLSRPTDESDNTFLARREALTAIVYDAVSQCEGSISAEHGIGQFKRDDFLKCVDPIELELMRRLKSAWDPEQLMNPGKVI